MKIFGFSVTRDRGEERSFTQRASASELIQFFGIDGRSLPGVTVDAALEVPAVWAAVSFLSRTLASLPLHLLRDTKDGPKRVTDALAYKINAAPNSETTSFGWRQYFWQQVFTGGRGLSYIDRGSSSIGGIYNFNPTKTNVVRNNGVTTYHVEDRAPYSAADVIDIPFMLRADGISHYGPVASGNKAIGLALAMNDYAGNFFNGGGIPPLAVKGPMPAGPEAMRRAQEQISQAIKTSRESQVPITNLPAGYELVPIGFDPEKGQMTEARRLQIEEIARIFNLPPVFLQDLTHGTFSNSEQQDLHLVKHVVAQWARAFEEELNLKLFGQRSNRLYVKHNLDGLMRGDFAGRMDGLVRAVQGGVLTPNEARALENRPARTGGDELFMQGATVPIGETGQQEAEDGN